MHAVKSKTQEDFKYVPKTQVVSKYKRPRIELPDEITNKLDPNLMRNVVGVDEATFNKFICPCRILGNSIFYFLIR